MPACLLLEMTSSENCGFVARGQAGHFHVAGIYLPAFMGGGAGAGDGFFGPRSPRCYSSDDHRTWLNPAWGGCLEGESSLLPFLSMY